MFKYLPYVRAYDYAGELMWIAQIEDFEQMTLVEGVQGGLPYLEFGGERYDIAMEVVAVGAGAVLVQTARYDRTIKPVREGPVEIRSYLVATATGIGAYIGNDLPRIGAVSGAYVAVFANDPYPRVSLYRMRI